MKKIVFSFLCALLAFTLTAEDQVDLDKQIAELEKERARLQTQLIQQRRNAIHSDKYAAKLAKEILILNEQLSEYLNTKPSIRPLNRKLAVVERKIKDLKQEQIDQKDQNSKDQNSKDQKPQESPAEKTNKNSK